MQQTIITMIQGRHKNCITPRTFYKDYLDRNPKNTPDYMDYTSYMKVVKSMMKKYKDFIINDAGIMNLPYRLGCIAVRKFKDKGKHLRTDWYLTKQEGKQVLQFNDHTNGYRYKLYWNKKKAIVKNKSYYSFFFTRGNNRELAKAIQNKVTDYFEFV